jgi:hypothetical protein
VLSLYFQFPDREKRKVPLEMKSLLSKVERP